LYKGVPFLLALALAGCGAAPADSAATGPSGAGSAASASAAASPETAASADAAASPDSATGAIAASADSSPLCGLFTAQEIEATLGAPVGAGSVAGPLGTACQWNGSSSDATYAQIQVIEDESYWSAPTLGEGYEELSGIGQEAYVIPELGGWTAGALTDKGIVAVALNGGTASHDSVIQFLRDVIARL
jgi:hypothetical protein